MIQRMFGIPAGVGPHPTGGIRRSNAFVGRAYIHYGMIATGDHGYLYRCAMPHPADRVTASSPVRSVGLLPYRKAAGGFESCPYMGISE